MSEVAPSIFRLGSEYVNCYFVEADEKVVLVDAGLPAYWNQVVTLLRWRERTPADIDAILLTHSHADHVGFLSDATAASRAQVYVHHLDAAPGKKRWPPPWPYARPTSWPWAAHASRAGILRAPNPEDVVIFGDGAALDVPGSPRVIHTPGHTKGSVCFHFPAKNVLFSGDSLVTFDPYSRGRSPRVMVDGVNEDPVQTRESLKRVGTVGAHLLLPGHGDPWDRGVRAAVDEAQNKFTSALPT
jgi:glyoxylase-like metal-dependent hydrolase (beta-lactamase superfamily II)